MLTLTYLALALLGAGYLLISVFMGHGLDFGSGGGPGDAHAHADGGEAHMDYGVDAGGHGSASAHGAHGAEFHFPFFSPLALATLFTFVGGFGLVALYGLRVPETASIFIAIPTSLVATYLVTYAGFRIVASSIGGSHIRLRDLPGAQAEVITPIPAGGIGEVAALIGGQRFTAPARETQGREVPRGARVKVIQMVGTTLLVELT